MFLSQIYGYANVKIASVSLLHLRNKIILNCSVLKVYNKEVFLSDREDNCTQNKTLHLNHSNNISQHVFSL